MVAHNAITAPAVGYGAIEAGVDKANKPPETIVTEGDGEGPPEE